MVFLFLNKFPELLSFFLLSLMNLILQIATIVLQRTMPVEFALVIEMSVFFGLEIIICIFEMATLNKAKLALLSQRAPPNNKEYLIKKELEVNY